MNKADANALDHLIEKRTTEARAVKGVSALVAATIQRIEHLEDVLEAFKDDIPDCNAPERCRFCGEQLPIHMPTCPTARARMLMRPLVN